MMTVSKCTILSLLASSLLLGGCASSNNVGDRAMMGGAIGAGLGAVASAVTHGSILHGAGWGAAGGILVGVLSD